MHSKRRVDHSKKHSAKPSQHPSTEKFVEGVLQLKGKFGFVLSEQPGVPDVIIQGHTIRLAMDGDRVKARVLSTGSDGRRSGEIVSVLQRAHKTVVGIFRRGTDKSIIQPENDAPPVVVSDMAGLYPKDGDYVVGLVTTWPSVNEPAMATLKEVIGNKSRPDVLLQTLIRRFELPHEFPANVEQEAASFGSTVPESAWHGRETCFDENVFTIDGADAKDFDDAVSIKKLPHGWRLAVHIADVSSYVKENSAVDAEAYERGTSVYLSGTVIPMLPFALSDGLCSLVPNQVRLTMACVMDIDTDGKVTSSRIFESAIKSCKRFTYEDVEAIIKGKTPADVPSSVIEDVKEMDRLALVLRKRRVSHGSLDFDFPEPYISVDPHGRPIDIQKRERLESHRLIEDFMVLANETVAESMGKLPFIYRVHDKPDPLKMQKLRKTLEAVGVKIPPSFDSGRPIVLQKVISSTLGKPIHGLVQITVLRSLKQAVYSEKNVGHFGLASESYTHFTSPIRRYPDLLVHRLLKEKIAHKLDGRRQQHWSTVLPKFALHCSRRERVAVEAERDYIDIQKARLMEKRVGEKFDGVVSSVTNFGLFVQLDEVFVEGLIHIANLSGDYFIFDEVRMSLRGKRSGRTFRIGQPVKVLLAAVNMDKHQLDFELVSSERESRPSAHSHRHRR